MLLYEGTTPIVEAIVGIARTYTFVFDPDPEGGFVVTCPALPGLVTHGSTLDEAREMARDAMEGYVEVLIEDGKPIPESEASDVVSRYDRLAHTLRPADAQAAPFFEQLTAQVIENV